MKVAIYARVSTDDQKTDLQLNDLRRYAQARNFTIVQEYIDEGWSGSKTSRPQLNQLMNAARKRKFDAVLVWKFDRFARSAQHLVEALSDFRARGIQFLSFTENIDTSTPMGEAMFTIVGAIAQLERDLIRERTRASLRAARNAGKVLGPPKLGKESEVLKLRASGLGFRQIAAQLGVSRGYAHSVVKKQTTKASAA